MKELTQPDMTAEFQHHSKVAETVKALRKIDGFMYNSTVIKAALTSAFTIGKAGILVLDCAVAEQAVGNIGIGKIPLEDPEEAVAKSSLLWQKDSLKYVTSTLANQGLDVSVWAFIGDDDFKYSVSPEFSLENPQVQAALDTQVQALGSNLAAELTPTGASVHISGWLSYELAHPEVPTLRETLLSRISASLDAGTLSPKVLKRLNSFIAWRSDLLITAGADPQEYWDLIKQQALHEMTSFVLQGHLAPDVVHTYELGLPLVFVNTYPDVGTQHLDDECVRLAGTFGYQGYGYGTIHLPGQAKLAKLLDNAEKFIPTMSFSCGEKITGQKKGAWKWKEKKI